MLRCSFSIRKMGKTHRELFSGLKLENGYYYFGKYKNAIRLPILIRNLFFVRLKHASEDAKTSDLLNTYLKLKC